MGAKEAEKEQTKILIVEDDVFLRKILVTKFTKEDYDVVSASDGSEALDSMRERKPDLVLLDLVLPAINGFEVLAEMRTDKDLDHIPVIVLSNLSQEEDHERVRGLGAIGFLVKTDLSINDVLKNVKETYAKHLSK